jgi:hypothetical protein
MTCSYCQGVWLSKHEGTISCLHCGRTLATRSTSEMPIPIRNQQCKKTTGGMVDCICVVCKSPYRVQRRNGKVRPTCSKKCYDTVHQVELCREGK